MAILFGQKMQRGEDKGYVGTFLKQINQIAKSCMEKNIKIVSNAGGLNPKSMAIEIEKILKEQSIDMKVAYIDGDDLMPTISNLKKSGEEFKNIDKGKKIRRIRLLSINSKCIPWCLGHKRSFRQRC
jgi:hypothetical protein